MSGAICCWWMSNVPFSPPEWRKDNYSRTSGSIFGLLGCWGRWLLIFPAALGHAQQPPSIPQNLPGNAQLVVSLLLHLLTCILSWFLHSRGFPVARMLWLRSHVQREWTHRHTDPPLLPLLFTAPHIGSPQLWGKNGHCKIKNGFPSSAELGAWKWKYPPRLTATPSFKATLPHADALLFLD